MRGSLGPQAWCRSIRKVDGRSTVAFPSDIWLNFTTSKTILRLVPPPYTSSAQLVTRDEDCAGMMMMASHSLFRFVHTCTLITINVFVEVAVIDLDK